MWRCRFVALLFTAACGMADSLPPGISPGTIVVDWHVGATGVLTHLPQGMQFFFGLELVGFPLVVYVLMKKRNAQ